MKIKEQGSVWYAESSYAERVVLKAAGWWWHGGDCRSGCRACAAGLEFRLWWTPYREKAARLIEYADAEAKATLTAVVETQAASRATDAAIEVPVPEGLAYRPFQKAGIAYALKRPSTLIADEMGLGKTIQALGLVNADSSIKSVLVVCPATLRLNWKREAEKWLVRPLRIAVMEGNDLPDADFVILNYDRLAGKNGKIVLGQILAREWDLLVADEAHYVKNPKAQRTKALLGKTDRKTQGNSVQGIVARAKRKLFLTGTPILNRPVEIHPLLSAIAPDQFGNFFSFAKRYCAAHQGRWGWEFDGASNLDELQERLRTICMVRRLKKDVLTELPAKTRQVIVVEPNGAGEVVRREAEAFARREDEIADLRAQADFAHASGDETAYKQAVQALRDRSLVAFTEMSEARHEVAIAKVPAVIAHLEGMLAEGVEKILVFAHHHDVVAALADRFGAEAVTLTGETPMNERDGIVQRFQSDTSVKIFIGSIRASGVGLTLTAAAHVVFAELDWTPANVTQAEDRCHRIGQENRLLVQHVVFDGSLDAKMAKMLVEKQGIADQALDDPFERDLPVASASESRPRQYPPTTPEQRAAALEALRRLAGVCDGAKLLDGQGFNKLDSKIGHRLASLGSLSDGQTWLASRLAMKYHRQLPADLLERIKSGSPSSLLIFS